LTPSIGVVVPTRNRVEQLATALRSVLAQSHAVDQIVVIDEGSSDGTAEFLSKLARDEERLLVIRNSIPRFLPAARNQGLQQLRTELVAFLDDDDAWAPQKLERQCQALMETGSQWAISGALWFRGGWTAVRAQRTPTRADFLASLLRGNAVPGGGSTVLATVAALTAAGGFDERARYMEDWDCWLSLAAHAGVPAILDAPLTAYRVHPGQMSDRTNELMDSFSYVESKHRDFAAKHGTRLSDRGLLDFAAGRLLRTGHLREARKIYWQLAWGPMRPKWLAKWALAHSSRIATTLSDRRFRAAVPRTWEFDVELWLTQLLRLEKSSVRLPVGESSAADA
jgi:glycosyltransferase involved in cell wall biosynthesis